MVETGLALKMVQAWYNGSVMSRNEKMYAELCPEFTGVHTDDALSYPTRKYTVLRKNLKRVVLVILSLLPVFLAGCATLPDTYSLIQRIPHTDPAPEIFSFKGALPADKRKEIIDGIERKAGTSELLQRQIPLMEAISDLPLVEGNKVTLILDDTNTHDAMFQAIRQAKHHINIETFIFNDDEAGRRLPDLLVKKRGEGVAVNLIYDAVGSVSTPPAVFQRLRDSGVNVMAFNPIDSSSIFDADHRDHRKILIVDGQIAFTGGVNIGHAYSESIYGKYGDSTGKISWRDTDIRVEGPVVAEFQKLFLETWKNQNGPDLPEADYFPHLRKSGKEIVRVVGSTPGRMNRITYMMYVAAILFAEESIHLTTAYFIPDEDLLNALEAAAKRGVDVKIVLPGTSDSALVFSAGRYYYSELLDAGVKIYERRGAVLHAKTAVIDGVWSTVGSTNLDMWSLLRDNEVNTVILGKDFAEEMNGLFRKDLQDSDEIEAKNWKKRSLFLRFESWFAHFFAYWL